MLEIRLPVLLFAIAGVAKAQDAEPVGPAREWIGGAPFTQWTRLTGDWGGLRNDLEELGIEVAGGFTGDLAGPVAGGDRHRSSFSTLLDVNAAFDLEVLLGLPKTLAYVDAYQIEGRDPSGDVGDFQGLSNIQGDDLRQIAEVWVETWLADVLRLKVGKVDFNSEFAFNETGGEFVNSSAGILPTIVAYPTYPDPAMSVNAFYVPSPELYFGFGIYDGATGEGRRTGGVGPAGFFGRDESDAYFLAAEVGTAWTGGNSWGSGRLALGAWHHTGHFDTFAGGTESGTTGAWLTFEQNVWRRDPTAEDDPRGIGAFVSLGIADADVSACASSIVVGVNWLGPLSQRPDDALGLAVLFADLSDEATAGTPRDETVIELFYKLQVTPALGLKPDLQYIVSPGGQTGVDDVLVAMLRFEVLF